MLFRSLSTNCCVISKALNTLHTKRKKRVYTINCQTNYKRNNQYYNCILNCFLCCWPNNFFAFCISAFNESSKGVEWVLLRLFLFSSLFSSFCRLGFINLYRLGFINLFIFSHCYPPLLCFSMKSMLFAESAVLVHFKSVWSILFVFHCVVISLFAFSAS